jgi:hypothetical protein
MFKDRKSALAEEVKALLEMEDLVGNDMSKLGPGDRRFY